MKFIVLALVAFVAIFATVGSSLSEASVSIDTELRAQLAPTLAEPVASGHADFRQRPDRMRFRVEVDSVSKPGIGRVIVSRSVSSPAPITVLDIPIAIVGDPLQGMAFGNMNLDSRLGNEVPVMQPGDMVEVLDASGELILRGALQVN